MLHLPQLSQWLNLSSLHCPSQLLIQQVHLMVVLIFQLMNLRHILVLLFLEILLPLHVELLQSFFANLDVVFELVLLDVGA